MNLLHLKYVIEVAKAGSISKAASNLYMNQPHLSKTIKDLEENMQIIIFERTSKKRWKPCIKDMMIGLFI